MLTEIAPVGERVTAVITSHIESGENFDGALIIGVYPHSNSEVWIEFQGKRANVESSDVDILCKQLKRAKKIAAEQVIAE